MLPKSVQGGFVEFWESRHTTCRERLREPTLKVSVKPVVLKLEKLEEPRLDRPEKPEVRPVVLVAEFNALLVFVCPSPKTHPQYQTYVACDGLIICQDMHTTVEFEGLFT
eukprot:2840383-Pyramimonas_sp.AAC.1